MDLPVRKPNRHKKYDYNSEGCYFITVCTQDRQNHFGVFKGNVLVLNDLGVRTAGIWQGSGEHNPGIFFKTFVVMPNHFHGIVEISRSHEINSIFKQPSVGPAHALAAPVSLQGTGFIRPAVQPKREPLANTGLSKAINGFKGAGTRYANANGFEFSWQRSFHDRILRGEHEYFFAEQYILHNPGLWEDDIENKWIDPDAAEAYYDRVINGGFIKK